MNQLKHTSFLLVSALVLSMILFGCAEKKSMKVSLFETSASGNKLSEITEFEASDSAVKVVILADEKHQTITGIGGSFTKASASLWAKMNPEKQKEIIEAYFGESGAKYSLTRTHINSCDFSPYNYAYAMVAGDTHLVNFSIEEDLKDLIPMIKAAKANSKNGFEIISSPWTAPPWMKDNNSWRGGKLAPAYYETWALYFSKYLSSYQKEGIKIWGITTENEPLGNDSNWESMHFSPLEMQNFVENFLGPKLKNDGHEVKILGFDQNRDEAMKNWVDVMFAADVKNQYYDGTAIHWYASTYDYFPEALQYVHKKAPGKHIIQTEACIDAEPPRWQNDAWYWSKEAKDWGWDWAPEDQKYLHPKYVPVFRYAGDIIGCLNNWVDGWVDWNMVLDKQGGPNWAKNWCNAPVIVDTSTQEIYYTPLYYTMAHFSKFIRPGAVRIGFQVADPELQVTAAQNPDGSIAVVLFNPQEKGKAIELNMAGEMVSFTINAKAIQTLIIHPKTNTNS